MVGVVCHMLEVGIFFTVANEKSPAFLFYPGDYLRDTQCLSENAQVAYDRIMCEHMRNICISQQRLKFFIKKLNDEEKEELFNTIEKIEGGFHIPWVSRSITKWSAYSESRRQNRLGKKSEKKKRVKKTYVPHMEKEKENEKEDNNDVVNKHEIQLFIEKNCENVSRLSKQMDNSDCEDLLKYWTVEQIIEKILSMENKKTLTKDYNSVKLTLQNWLKRDFGKKEILDQDKKVDDIEKRINEYYEKQSTKS